MLEFLIRRGVDFRVVHNGRTLCHSASEGCLAVFFAHGADLNAKDSDGRTPIRVAYAGEIATLISTGIDVSQRRQFAEARELCFFAAGGHAAVPVSSISRREVAWACNQITERQFELLRLRAFQMCVGLEERQLPALVTCEILAFTFAPLESLVAFHRVWAIVTTIKHFQRRGPH